MHQSADLELNSPQVLSKQWGPGPIGLLPIQKHPYEGFKLGKSTLNIKELVLG